MAAERSFYVTTPIYYVNAAPHLGHAYTTIAADVMARHHRQRGEDVFFLTGTDEHGEPVADAAKAQGLEPKELADRNAERFKALAPLLEATNDFFIRTSDPEHISRVQEVLQRVYDNGFVHEGLYEGWYCPRCADFKVENEIEEGNRCPIHHIELERHSEQNYFFALSAFQERLEALYAEQPDFVTPRVRYNEALSFIKSGLQDISLSRAQLTWGVPVPWDTSHVFYVWFDALLNYYTALGFAREGEDLTEQFWPATYHVIGKDILRFHTVFWPAMLMAADLPVPEHVFVHGYLLMDGEKMSKSLGNVLDPFEIIERFGTDALRYYLLRDVTFGEDGSVSTEAFERRYDTELANELGNLASRTLSMVGRYRDGDGPGRRGRPGARRRLRRPRRAHRASASTASSSRRPSTTSGSACGGSTATSRSRRPGSWPRTPNARPTSIASCARWPRACASSPCCSSPWIPGAAEKLLAALGAPDLGLAGARFGAGDDRRGRSARAAVPAKHAVIDSHTHLDSCAPPNAELVAAAAREGVTRILTVGMDAATNRSALQAAEDFPQVLTAVGRHPNHAEGFDEADLADLQALAAHPRCAAIGETGLDYFRDYAPRADQERAFHAQIELARATGKPLVIHTRAAEDDTVSTLKARAHGLEVVMHCFSMPDRLDECLAEGWWISFAGNVTYPKATDLARRGRARARRPPPGRDRRALSHATARAQGAQPAGLRHVHSALRRRAPRRRLRGARAPGRRQRCHPLRVVTGELPTQPSLRRLRQFGVRPKRDLGQNFLIDSNILGVIERAAELEPADPDVVLEIGGGLGVLSEHLAAHAAHVHVVELDRALVPALEDALAPHPNTTLHVADALDLDLGALTPAPTKVVANLPYGIAASAILRTIEELDGVTRWVAMVQREVGERFAASAGHAGVRRAQRARPARV